MAAAQDTAQTFTLDGRLYSDSIGSTPMVDGSIQLKIQILNPADTCILFEQWSTVNTSSSNGYFTVQVGALTSDSSKRKGSDPGLAMAQVYSNAAAMNGKLISNGANCTYTPTAADERHVRLQITPSFDNVTRTLTTNMALDSVPSAVVAERAESLQGFAPSQFLQVSTTSPANLTQSNVENIFSNTNYSRLVTILNNGTSGYAQTGSNGSVLVPTVGVGSTSGLTSGQMWFQSGVLKYYDGSSIQTVGASGSGLTSLVAGTGLTGGTITTGGQTIAVDVGTTSGQIVQVQGGAKLPSLDASDLTNIPGNAFKNSAITGSTSINITGNIQTTGSTTQYRTYLYDHSGAGPGYVGFAPPSDISGSGGASYTMTLPDRAGLTGQVLMATTSTGVLGWTTPNTLTNVSGDITLSPVTGSGSVLIDSGTASLNSTSGALIVTGGVGVSGNINSGGMIYATTSVVAGSAMVSPRFYGSAAAGGSIKIDGTSNGTAGDVLLATSGGRVGIGTTTPDAMLTVYNTSTTADSFKVDSSNSGGGSVKIDSWGNMFFWNGLKIGYNGTYPTDAVIDGNGGSLVLLATAASKHVLLIPGAGGYVGVGTTVPTAPLEISGAVRAGSYNMNTTGTATSNGMNSPSTNSIGLWTGSSERIRIDSNGWVGIGTTSPAAPFVTSFSATNGTTNPYNMMTNTVTTTVDGDHSARNLFNRLAVKVGAGHLETGNFTANEVRTLRNTSGSSDNGSATGQQIGVSVIYGHDDSDAAATPNSVAAYGLKVSPYMRTGTLSVMYDIYMAADSTGGTVGTHYGIYQVNTGRNYFAGNVGIGTTAPTQALDVAGTVRAQQFNLSSSGTITNASTNFTFTATGGGNYNFNSSGGTNLMTVLQGGNVGIGTTVPARLLQVAGPIRLTASTSPSSAVAGDIYVDSADSNKLKWWNGSDWQTAGGSSQSGVSNIANGSGDITLSPVATSGRVYVDSNTASTLSSNGALVVLGGAGVSGDINAGGSINSSGSMSVGTTLWAPQIYGYSSASKDVRIDGTSGSPKGNVYLSSAGGLVGVGTTVPSQNLHVYNANSTYLKVSEGSSNDIFLGSDSSAGSFFSFAAAHDGNFRSFTALNIGTGSSAPLRFATDSIERMRISQSGFVGIGTTAPTFSLETVGSAKVTGSANVAVTNSTTFTGGGHSHNVASAYDFGPLGNGGSWSGNGSRTGVVSIGGGGVSYQGGGAGVYAAGGDTGQAGDNRGWGGVGVFAQGGLNGPHPTFGQGYTPYAAAAFFNGYVQIGSNDGRATGLAIGTNFNGYNSVIPPSEGLYVKGNVGIGTTTPGVTLEVNGTSRSISSLETVIAAGTCSTSYNVNPSTGTMINLTLNGACTIGVTGLLAGHSFSIRLTQSSTTAPTFSSAFKWPAGTAPTWSTSATKYDVVSCASFDGTTLMCTGMADVR